MTFNLSVHQSSLVSAKSYGWQFSVIIEQIEYVSEPDVTDGTRTSFTDENFTKILRRKGS